MEVRDGEEVESWLIVVLLSSRAASPRLHFACGLCEAIHEKWLAANLLEDLNQRTIAHLLGGCYKELIMASFTTTTSEEQRTHQRRE